jgi:hypothetical protein
MTRNKYLYGVYLVTSGTGVAFQMAGAKDTFTNISSWKSYLQQQYAAGTPVTIWYILATPQTAIVNEPLMKIGDYADSLTTSIPCTAGENTLDVQTTVQPSEVTAGFSGWHPVSAIHEKSRNLVDVEEFAEGLVNSYDGSITANANYITSDYIWFQAGIYTMSMINGYTGSGTTTNRIATYNAQKVYINCIVDITGNRAERPQYTISLNEDCYLRIGIRKTDTELMLNEGSTALPYEPYWK